MKQIEKMDFDEKRGAFEAARLGGACMAFIIGHIELLFGAVTKHKAKAMDNAELINRVLASLQDKNDNCGINDGRILDHLAASVKSRFSHGDLSQLFALWLMEWGIDNTSKVEKAMDRAAKAKGHDGALSLILDFARQIIAGANKDKAGPPHGTEQDHGLNNPKARFNTGAGFDGWNFSA